MNNDEIKHYGVLGMKWGLRRYQNADGTLTSAGKRRAKKLRDQYSLLTGKQLKKIKSNDDNNYKKTFVKLNDRQLQNRINRLSKEKQMKDLERDLKRETQSTGARLRGKVLNQVILPAATEAGKNALKGYLEKQFKKALGLNIKGKTFSNKEKKELSKQTNDVVDNIKKDIKQAVNNAKSVQGSEKKQKQDKYDKFYEKYIKPKAYVEKKNVQTGEATMQEIWKEWHPDLVD